MVQIKRAGGLNNGRSRHVTALRPMIQIGIRSMRCRDFRQNTGKPIRIAEDRLKHAVVIKTEFLCRRRIRSFSGNQNRCNHQIAAGLVKVLEIERIIPNLLGILPIIGVSPNFEFQHKDDAVE